jgi:hypothetical protein
MTPKLEESHSYDLQHNAYVNNGYENNEKPSVPKIEISTDGKQHNQRPVIDFDDLLPHVGDFGRYQKILFLLMIPFAFFVAFVYFSQIFIIIVPEKHWCNIPELSHLNER